MLKQLKKIVIQKPNILVLGSYFTYWLNVLKILVYPDFIYRIVPQLSTDISTRKLSLECFSIRYTCRSSDCIRGSDGCPHRPIIL